MVLTHTHTPFFALFEVRLVKVDFPLCPIPLETIINDVGPGLPVPSIVKQINNVGMTFFDGTLVREKLVAQYLVPFLGWFSLSS